MFVWVEYQIFQHLCRIFIKTFQVILLQIGKPLFYILWRIDAFSVLSIHYNSFFIYFYCTIDNKIISSQHNIPLGVIVVETVTLSLSNSYSEEEILMTMTFKLKTFSNSIKFFMKISLKFSHLPLFYNLIKCLLKTLNIFFEIMLPHNLLNFCLYLWLRRRIQTWFGRRCGKISQEFVEK